MPENVAKLEAPAPSGMRSGRTRASRVATRCQKPGSQPQSTSSALTSNTAECGMPDPASLDRRWGDIEQSFVAVLVTGALPREE